MNNSYLERARKKIHDPQILCVIAAKRAKQLSLGARPMVRCDSPNQLDTALLEIAEGFLTFEFPEESEAGNHEAAEPVATGKSVAEL
ncbi:MAG: DNA-directed RNA polymerase subunit omega [Victivallaceae bacterium]|nr:DNA-directed RNA polymerase subunit omega [Victivallaceae bacterium]